MRSVKQKKHVEGLEEVDKTDDPVPYCEETCFSPENAGPTT